MARAFSKVGQKYVKNGTLKLKQRSRDYTPEPGQYGRGEANHLYDCLLCSQGDHQACENSQMIMCRCWRTKHNSPPPPRGRKPIKQPTQVVEEIEDDEWEDA